MAYMGSRSSVARKPEEWYDATARTTEEWDPVIEARTQQARLAHVHLVLCAYLSMPDSANRPRAVRWRELAEMLVTLWCRLTGDNPLSVVGSTHEVLPMHEEVAKNLELRWWANQVVSEATEAGTVAVTAALDARLKKVANQMAFYFSREIEELERMFGLD